MTKANKTLSIIFLILVFSISITFSFISLNNYVYADSVEENLIYTLNNVIFPIALNYNSNYNQFVNAYIQFSCKIDISKQTLSFENVRLMFMYNIFKDITAPKEWNSNIVQAYPFYESEIIINDYGTNTLSMKNYLYNSGSNYQFIARNNFTIRTKGLLSGSETNLNSRVSLSRSAGLLTNISYVKYSSYEGVYSGNEYGLYNFLTYFDTNNNYVSIGFNVYSLVVNTANYPMLSTSYEENLSFCHEIKNYYPLKINERNYYFNALTESQIQSESYQQGYNNGLQQGELNGYDIGFNAGQEYGYNSGFEIGKNEGIALKGENVWSNSTEFIKSIFVSIFDILSIELLPNISLGTFVVIPLIFSVLFFIVKIAKGGGD